MKKQLLTFACMSAVLISSSALAATKSTSLGNLKLNIKTPELNKTTKTTSTKKQTNSAEVEKMKSQINALNDKMASISSNYQKTVNDITNNLLSKDDLNKLKAKTDKLKNSKKDAMEINIDIAEDGTIMLNNALETNGKALVQNLTSSKKAAIKKDILSLNSEKAAYTQIANQAKELISSIKGDPLTAAVLTPELVKLAKTSKESLKQVQNITKLSANLTKVMGK